MIGRLNSNFFNRECHIIGIGIDKYKYKDWKTLKNCESDVERFINTVCKSFKTFEDTSDYVTRLYNQDATRELIRSTILGKLNSLKSPQNLIIYFACHGKNYEENAYLAPYDAQSDYVNPANSKFISYQDIFNWIDNKDAWHIVLILDCCHAGRIMNAKRSTIDRFKNSTQNPLDNIIGEEDFETLINTKSAWVITSGSDDETVSDGDENGSPFSQKFIGLLDYFVKIKNPVSIAYIGSVLKNRFPKKYKQKPNFYHLKDILGYKNSGGEFVFEPNGMMDKEEIEKDKIKTALVESKPKATQPSTGSLIKPNEPENTPFKSENRPVEPENIPFESENKPFKPEEKRALEKHKFKVLLSLIMLFLITSLYINLTSKKTILDITSQETWEPPSIIYIPPMEDDTTKPKSATEVEPKVNKKKHVKLKPNNNSVLLGNSTIYADDNSFGNGSNLVFVGSFENKLNAEAILERVKKIGYENAEIIMKDHLPYAVVVTGFYQFKSSAIAEVKALRKRGIEVYHSNVDLSSIYKKKD